MSYRDSAPDWAVRFFGVSPNDLWGHWIIAGEVAVCAIILLVLLLLWMKGSLSH